LGRLGRAVEAVAGTLRRLTLTGSGGGDLPAGACHELGAAVGKLRRLRYLKLDTPGEGRDYRAAGRGVAASGGCPELFQVGVGEVSKNTHRVAGARAEPGRAERARALHRWTLHRGGGTAAVLRPGASGPHQAPPEPQSEEA
jgi:hypothetical protein